MFLLHACCVSHFALSLPLISMRDVGKEASGGDASREIKDVCAMLGKVLSLFAQHPSNNSTTLLFPAA